MGRRRIVICSRIFAPEAAAASFRLEALAQALVARGFAVDVLTAALPRGVAEVDIPGVRIHRFPVLRDGSGYVRGYLPYASFDAPLAARLAALPGPRPAVVVYEPPPTTGCVVRAVCAARRIPYIAYVPDVWSRAAAGMDVAGPVARVLAALEGCALRGARAAIAVTDQVATQARALGARHLNVVENGINTDVFTPVGPAVDPQRLRAAGVRGPYFVYAGTASEWQGADIFARAACEAVGARAAHVVYLGQGTGWPAIRAWAQRSGGRVHALGPVPPAEAAAWQRGAAAALVSLVPGQGYDFAYPTKVFAALACGTPVIYAGTGPARADIRDHRLGWQCDYDVAQVGAAMDAALERPGRGGAERLAEWVRAHHSLHSTGTRAAAAIARAICGQPG